MTGDVGERVFRRARSADRFTDDINETFFARLFYECYKPRTNNQLTIFIGAERHSLRELLVLHADDLEGIAKASTLAKSFIYHCYRSKQNVLADPVVVAASLAFWYKLIDTFYSQDASCPVPDKDF